VARTRSAANSANPVARDLRRLRLQIGDVTDARAAIGAVHRERLAALTHGRLPLEAIPSDVTPPRRPGRHPTFNILFVLQTYHDRLTPELADLDVTQLTSPTAPLAAGLGPGFDCGLVLWAVEGRLAGHLDCDGDVLDADDLPAFASRRTSRAPGIAAARSRTYPRQARTADAAITSTNRSVAATSWPPRRTHGSRRCRPQPATPAPDRIDIGTLPGATTQILPAVVRRLLSEHPGCDIRLSEVVPEDPQIGDLDLLFHYGRIDGDVEHVELLDEPYLLVAGAGAFPDGPVRVKLLDDAPMVVCPPPMPSTTLSVIVEIVCLDTCAP
jgi:hypothetical protein